MSSIYDKRIQSIDLIETYAHTASKYLLCKKEEIKCNNTMQNNEKMFNFDYITKEPTKEHISNWPGIPDYLEKQMHYLI